MKSLDLRGVKCPLNWAKARVVLDSMARGETLTLLLDDPRALHDIPRAAEACGHAAGEPHDRGGYWELLIVA